MRRPGAVLVMLVCAAASAAPLSGPALVAALQRGGYVLVMRHADAPTAPSSAAEAAPGNTAVERQLDAHGRATAAAMGEALRVLRIPLARIVVSPAFRTRETLMRAGLKPSVIEPNLADLSGESDARVIEERIRWLEEAAARSSNSMSNVLYVTHSLNIRFAFKAQMRDCACAVSGIPDAGQMLVLSPGRPATFVGSVRIESWPDLARTSAR